MVWSAALTLLLAALRLQVLASTGGEAAVKPAALLWAMADQLLCGMLFALLYERVRAPLAALGLRLLLLAYLFVNVAAFAYEAVFVRLPTAGVLFYLQDPGELGPTLAANGGDLLTLVELGFGFALLELLWRRLKDRSFTARARRIGCGLLLLAFASSLTLRLMPAAWWSVHPSRLRAPLPWLVEATLREHAAAAAPAQTISPQAVLDFQYELGVRPPRALAHGSAPLCAATSSRPDLMLSPPGAILLILESVGTREMELEVDGEPLMPELRAFAARHHLLPDVKAAGTKSSSAMPALFAGLPPQTAENLLHQVPLNTMEGFVNELVARGYRSAYFHGADLNWEFQRSFLRMVGIQEISERDPRLDLPVYGWGYADELVLGRLRRWIGEHRQTRPEQPFFAALFSLSSHDPYDLPPDWTRRFDEHLAQSRQYEALAYLDHHLGRFLAWYEASEAPRGTVLALVGDHTPHLFNTVDSRVGPVFRFQVPLVVAAPGRVGVPSGAVLARRRGAQHDVPATLMTALGLPVARCDQGIDLLMDEARWPADRIVYSVGGEELEEIQIWRGAEHVLVDRLLRGVQRLDEAAPPSAAVGDFLELLLPLNRYLGEHDAYAPPRRLEALARPSSGGPEGVLVVSHRGNTEGPQSRLAENSLAAVVAAFAAGFPAVEVDLQMTADGIAVLHHDASLVDPRGVHRPLAEIDRAELAALGTPLPSLADLLQQAPAGRLVLELKPQGEFERELAFAEHVAAELRARAGARPLILDSFSLLQASTVKPLCTCEVGWDIPYGRDINDAYLQSALLAGLDWLFVEARALSPAGLARARELGLKVMAYTVNDEADLAHLQGELPDGIISDSRRLLEVLRTPTPPSDRAGAPSR